jgi:hypothetical protein
MRQQLGQPGRIVHVGLATGHVFDMRGVGQHQPEATPASTCQTGFQYTPVASAATCVQPLASSHSANSISRAVVVSNLRTARDTSPP